jgi:catechol 2,3-dioxygenase-like lactoylglutathione lyase family enzyme
MTESTNRPPRFDARAITIHCTDLDRSDRFYRAILGGEFVPADGGFQRRYRFGTWELILLPNAEAVSPATFPTHAMPLLWLEVADLPAAVAWLTQHQVTIVDPGDDQSLMIADPDGIVIEVWARASQS